MAYDPTNQITVQSILQTSNAEVAMTPAVEVPPGHALVTYTRVEASSLKTTTRVSRGRRCSIRSYHMEVVPMPGVDLEDRPRAYAYAEGDLSRDLAKVARSGSFTAIIASPWSKRPVIVAIVDHEAAAAAARRARIAIDDAEWEAAGRAARAAATDRS